MVLCGWTDTDRQTDRHGRANSCFSQLSEQAYKRVYDQCKTWSLYSPCHMFILFEYTVPVPEIFLFAVPVKAMVFFEERHTKYFVSPFQLKQYYRWEYCGTFYRLPFASCR